jgi:hypothetical protein
LSEDDAVSDVVEMGDEERVVEKERDGKKGVENNTFLVPQVSARKAVPLGRTWGLGKGPARREEDEGKNFV